MVGSDSVLIMMGDFNIPGLVDSTGALNIRNRFDNLTNILNLKQFNEVLNINNIILDLILSNYKIKVGHCDCPLEPENDNHPSLEGSIMFSQGSTAEEKTFNEQYNFEKADFLKMYNLLKEIDWNPMNKIRDIDSLVEKFYIMFEEVLRECVPLVRKSERLYPTWFNYYIISQLRKKNYLRTQLKKNKNVYHHQVYKYFRNKTKLDIKKAYDEPLGN
ncbi:hypothetical protein JTB14_016378 [Gonioctena quinquepunctata]|nr:hypothetical protein JTB14_016378 [Gonioctena quinquepunctata]